MFSYLENALRQEIADGHIRAISPESWFDWIEARFPAGFNRIAWERVSGMQRVAVLDSPRQITAEELQVLLAMHRCEVEAWLSEAGVEPDAELIWIGDNADQGISTKAAVALKQFPLLMSFPQHSYLLSPDAECCVNYVMEGDLFFWGCQSQFSK